jgi:hypothetical protein
MKTRSDYEREIRELLPAAREYAGTEAGDKLAAKLEYRLNKWYSFLPITLHVANNEQTPWTSDELGIQTEPMPLKEATGLQQVGDYHAVVDGQYVPLCIERKGCTVRNGRVVGCDLYSTLMNSDSRERFYREIDRFQQDPRFGQFLVIAECSFEQFLQFTPLFTGKKRNKFHLGAHVASRRGAINSLFAKRGVPVFFAGSRAEATKCLPGLIKQAVLGNFERWLH